MEQSTPSSYAGNPEGFFKKLNYGLEDTMMPLEMLQIYYLNVQKRKEGAS